MRMLPRPSCPRAGQSGLWQNWSCGSIGAPPGARFDDHARRDARWTRAIQAPTILITVPWGATGQCELTQIRRQREEWRRQTVEHFSRGEAREALTAYAAREQLHVAETREEAIRGLVERWKADNGIQNPKDVLLLASLNAEVRAINRQCQEERLRAGELREEKLSVGGDDIHVHDRVLLTKRDRKLGVENGFMGEVIRIDQETATLRVRLDQDDGRSVALRVAEYGAKNIRLGYASTVHQSQGRTVEHCHVLMGGHMTDRHLGYVQASRSRESTHLFIDRSHAGPDLGEAIRSLSRDRTKDLASDILDRSQTLTLEQEQALQQRRRYRL